jgi:hypothetical protein
MKNVFFLAGQKLGKIINAIKRKYQSYKELDRDFQNTKIIQRFTHPFLYKIFAPGVVFFIIAVWSLSFLNSDTNKSVNIIKQYTGSSKEQEFLNYLNTLSKVDLAYCSMVTARVAWSVIGLKEEEVKFLFEISAVYNKMGRNKWGETFVGTVEAIKDEVRNMTHDQLLTSLRKCY